MVKKKLSILFMCLKAYGLIVDADDVTGLTRNRSKNQGWICDQCTIRHVQMTNLWHDSLKILLMPKNWKTLEEVHYSY